MRLPDCPDCKTPVDFVELKPRTTLVIPGPRFGNLEPYEIADATRVSATHRRCGVEFIWYVGPGINTPPPGVPEHTVRSEFYHNIPTQRRA